MIMLSILAMTALVFTSRYLFLEPKLPLRLSPAIQRLLSYSSPAVLTAIWAPIVFMPETDLWINAHNPYLWAAALAGLIAWKTKNVLLTTVASMVVFLVLNLIIFTH
ncbi:MULTISPECIES: AzlD domain-containing protein [Vibrio]|uniref:AzlD domain-containing protein n=1 Tax=Vibrio aestuarianus TaxID=28171 RepID=A0A7X6N8I6_9VIBR|nr:MULTISPECIES: AzlD domain-containing protein [Vibrio]KOE80640.1 branched-chain amino acid ABC transporter [Vibrio alginolyticus]MBD1564894.1 AzlD domain-containing protein [Vibrio sp. S12_S33]MDE1209513.1 AzlD domain-containing protein [Vibrio aestuarianus]MDE1214735.1 AzlD domain-containing protein [Vibrio aestuarianus]MDE1219077.1 AzlD domain-containing protein [Vibrio aestuarianus]